MKIVFWNIQKVGDGKLKKSLNAGVIAAGGLGGTVADYVVKVVLGDAVWNKATSSVPVDAFVIIELVSGGASKGAMGTGTCLRALQRLEAALNAAAKAANLSPLPVYRYVAPKVTGRRETVGILYNSATLTYVSDEVMRDAAGAFLPKRSPLWAQFTVGSTSTVLNLIGIHGPTSQPMVNYTEAVSYTNKLAGVTQIAQTGFNPIQATLIGGDFNCDGTSTYASGNGAKANKISGFSGLTGTCNYVVTLPGGTKTSLVRNVGSAPPITYLSQPYDNIVYQLPGQSGAAVAVIDLCAGAPTWGSSPVATFNAARKVSDHLPIGISW